MYTEYVLASPKGRSFRSSAGFGRRIEYWIIGRMLKEGMDVYVPFVDDHARKRWSADHRKRYARRGGYFLWHWSPFLHSRCNSDNHMLNK